MSDLSIPLSPLERSTAPSHLQLPVTSYFDEDLFRREQELIFQHGPRYLGHALAGYAGFAGNGFPVVALFDIDSDLVGVRINGILIDHVDELRRVCAERGVTIGMIATPGQAAQGVCDQLVACGVRCILNFAPAVLQVPEDVEVRKVDLAVELQVLAFHVARRHLAAADGPLNAVAQAAAAAINGAGRRVTGGTS